jgi:hypothetical protein
MAGVKKLPLEIADMIRGQIGWRISLEEAREWRRKWMEEKETADHAINRGTFEVPYRAPRH